MITTLRNTSFFPTRRELRLILDAADEIEPPYDMKEWFNTYSRDHAYRLACDSRMILELVPKNHRILEVGAVPPILTTALSNAGYTLDIVDIAPERFANQFAKLGVGTHACDIEQEKLPETLEGYDCVIFNEIFEHLRVNLIFTMRQVLGCLKPGGILLLSTPNMRSLSGIYSLLIKNRSAWCCPDIYKEYGKLEDLGHMGHIREYTSKDVARFLEQIGFQVCNVVFRNHKPGAGVLLKVFPKMRPFMTLVARKV